MYNIIFSGNDGSGKTTLIHELYERLNFNKEVVFCERCEVIIEAKTNIS